MLQTIAYYLTGLYRDFSGYSRNRLASQGLHYGMLYFVLYVGRYPGCTPAQLTEALQADWGHSQRTVAKLAEEGFLTRERAAGRGRAYRLFLTDKGQRAFRTAHDVFTEWDAAALARLTEAEQAQLRGLLQKLTDQTLPGGVRPDALPHDLHRVHTQGLNPQGKEK